MTGIISFAAGGEYISRKAPGEEPRESQRQKIKKVKRINCCQKNPFRHLGQNGAQSCVAYLRRAIKDGLSPGVFFRKARYSARDYRKEQLENVEKRQNRLGEKVRHG